MHAVQDFYSHSTWAEDTQRAGFTHSGAIPLWFDIAKEKRATLPLVSGAYPDGSSPGHKNHSDLNHDFTGRPNNTLAVDAATRASADWITRLQADDPSLPWDEMKSYNIQKDMILKRFLEQYDATFVTSTSIVLGHFDGPTPKKTVFSTDLGKEKAQAAAALVMTAQAYAPFMSAKDNVNKLPTPYWSSHFIYHVPRDIADGMLCNDVTYNKPTSK